MRVNKRLEKYVSINPTKSRLTKSVEDLVKEAISQEILLPQYQTDIRWTIHKYVALLNYQLMGKAPVSALSMHEIGKDDLVTQINFLDRQVVQGNLAKRLSTTDGQQRITCNLKAYIDHDSFKPIVLDLKKGKFLLNYQVIKKEYQIPVGILLNQDIKNMGKYVDSRPGLKENYYLLTNIRTKMLQYTYVVNVGKDMSQVEQLEWFEKLNNAGSIIPKLQLKLTKMTRVGIDIYAEYTNKFLKILDDNGMKELLPMKTTEFSIPISTLNPYIAKKKNKTNFDSWSPFPSQVKVRDLCSLDVEDIRTGFKKTLNALERAIKFFYDNDIEVSRYEYLTYITGFIVYCDTINIEISKKDDLIKWINDTNFRDMSNSIRRGYFSELLNLRF